MDAEGICLLAKENKVPVVGSLNSHVIIAPMKTKTADGKTELENFTRTMKALFKVPKSAVQQRPKRKKKRS